MAAITGPDGLIIGRTSFSVTSYTYILYCYSNKNTLQLVGYLDISNLKRSDFGKRGYT